MQLLTRVETHAELARELKLSDRSVVSNWKRRGTVPLSECLQLARRYGVTLDWLLTGEGAMYRRAAPSSVRDSDSAGEDAIGLWLAQDEGPFDGLFGPPEQPQPPDRRLAAVLDWWRAWWATASEEDRVWALVQLRRNIPEAGEWLRRRGL